MDDRQCRIHLEGKLTICTVPSHGMPFSMAAGDKSFLLTEHRFGLCLWKHTRWLLSVFLKRCGLHFSGVPDKISAQICLRILLLQARVFKNNVPRDTYFNFLALYFFTCLMTKMFRRLAVVQRSILLSYAPSRFRNQQEGRDVWFGMWLLYKLQQFLSKRCIYDWKCAEPWPQSDLPNLVSA